MTALAIRDSSVVNFRQTLGDLLSDINSADDTEQLLEAKDRIRLAREWAKIHKTLSEIHLDLLRAEVSCLRRIGQLSATSVLPSHARPAAQFFATLSDDEVDRYLAKYGAASTAVGVYRLLCKRGQQEENVEYGRRFAQGCSVSVDGEPQTEASWDLIDSWSRGRTRAALAILLEDFASRSFTVGEMADEVLLETGLAEADSDFAEIRQGVSEICRSAIRKAPALTMDGQKVPTFVTCRSLEAEGYLRVPFAQATLRQFAEMVDLRRRQLAEDQAAFDRLKSAYQSVLAGCGCCPPLGIDDPMGDPSQICRSDSPAQTAA